jgi:hypothetical protein
VRTGARASGRTLFVLVAALAVSANPAEAASEREKPDFSGIWQLNQDDSDDPREKLQEMRSRRGGPGSGGPGMPGPGMGRPGMGGPGTGPSGEGSGGPRMMRGLERLEIQHQDPKLLIIYADDRDRTIYTDGRKVNRDSERGLVEVQAKWRKGKLVVERKPERGPKLKETYELSSSGDRLYVTSEIDGGRMGSMELRRAYDAVGEDSSDQR